MFRNLAEDAIAALTGLIDIAGLEREAETLGGRVRLVNGQVTPPDAAIVPKMMIGVLLIHSQGELGLPFHAFRCLGLGFKKGRFLSRSCISGHE